MDLGLKNKVALVTGGVHGVGAGITEVFAMEGCNVAANYSHSDKEAAEEFASKMSEKYGVKVVAIKCDISKEENILNMFDQIYETFGGLDIVINNANYMAGCQVLAADLTLEQFHIAESVDLEAVIVTCRELVKHCRKFHKPGHIVNVLTKSIMWSGSLENTAYCAVKSGNAGYTRALAHEVAKEGIFVNAILPGYVMNERTLNRRERYERTIKNIPLRRYALPIEMGYTCAYLCSDKAYQINGAIIDCTGGTLTGGSCGQAFDAKGFPVESGPLPDELTMEF